MIDLSVSTSSSGWPRSIDWPTSTSHRTTVTVSSTVPTAGIRIATSIIGSLFDRPCRAAEQLDPLEHGVAHGEAAGHQDILRPAHPEQAMGVGGVAAERRPDGLQVSLLEVCAEIDLGHAQGDGRAERFGRDARPAVEDQRDRHAPVDLLQQAQVQARLPVVWMWTLPTLTASRSMPVAATNSAAAAGSVDEPPWAGPSPAAPCGSSPSSASTATPRAVGQARDRGHARHVFLGWRRGVGEHDQIEARLDRRHDPIVARALVEDQPARHRRRLRRRSSQAPRKERAVRRSARPAQELAVEAQDDG